MNNNQLCFIMVLFWFLIIFLSIIWTVKNNYKKHQNNSSITNLYLAIKDFLNSDGASNRGYMLM